MYDIKMVKKSEVSVITPFDIKGFVARSRNDIAFANPISFLLRAMSGEKFEDEDGNLKGLSLRDRIEVGKFLSKFIIPNVDSEEIGVGSSKNVMPPPLTIIMNNSVPNPVKVETIDPNDSNDHIKIKPQVIDI